MYITTAIIPVVAYFVRVNIFRTNYRNYPYTERLITERPESNVYMYMLPTERNYPGDSIFIWPPGPWSYALLRMPNGLVRRAKVWGPESIWSLSKFPTINIYALFRTKAGDKNTKTPLEAYHSFLAEEL